MFVTLPQIEYFVNTIFLKITTCGIITKRLKYYGRGNVEQKGVTEMYSGTDKKRGLRLKLARERAMLSQQELADKLSCSQSQVSKIELGADFDLSLAKKISRILKISYEYIADGE